MHLNNTIANAFVIATLDAAEQLDGDPFLFTLHECGHDLGDAVLIQGFGLDIVNVFFILFSDFLLARLLRDGGVPIIAIIDSKGLDGGIRQLGTSISLCLATNEAGAVGFAAVAWLRVCSVAVNVVIENQLFALLDVSLGKYSHAKFVTHYPFVHVTIRIARMVTEPAQISFLGRIDELTFAERHEVKMFDALLIVLDHAAAKMAFIDDFANIFKYEIISS